MLKLWETKKIISKLNHFKCLKDQSCEISIASQHNAKMHTKCKNKVLGNVLQK